MVRNKLSFLPIISGILLGLTWNNLLPAVSLFIAFIPLLFLLDDNNSGTHRIFIQSFLAFFIFHLIAVWWIYKSGFWGFIAVISINSFLMAGVLSLSYFSKQIFGKFAGYWALTAYWLSFEYLHYSWDLQWPFMNLGNWFGQIPALIQWYEYSGVLGGTLWVLLINIFIYELFLSIKRKHFKSIFINGVFLLFIIIFPLLWSNSLLHKKIQRGKTLQALIIQPNINPYTEKYDKSLFQKQINAQVYTAENNLDTTVDLLIFPETSLPLYLNRDSLNRNKIIKHLQRLSMHYPRLSVIAGIYTYKIDKYDTLYYNTAIFIDKNKSFVLHDKSKLVPGVERTPFIRFLNFFPDWNADYGGINSSLQIAEEQTTFETKDFKIAVLICYESVFGNYSAQFAKKDANIIAVITNDAWWGNTAAYGQILMHSRLRAIESRRQIIRVANTGISALINEKGVLVKSLPLNEKSALKLTAQTNNRLTFYVKNGDIIGRIAVFTSIILLLASYVRKKKEKYKV